MNIFQLKEALKFALLLSKYDRYKLARIRDDKQLELFCSKYKADFTPELRAIISALPKLLDYINQIDSESNIKEVLFDTAQVIKGLCNYDARVMRHFYDADCFILFKTAKCIGVRFNTNYKSFRFIKCNHGKITNLNNPEIAFRQYFGFNKPKNNGIYTIVVEALESNYKKHISPPVRIIDTEEDELRKFNFLKNKTQRIEFFALNESNYGILTCNGYEITKIYK